MGLEGTVYFFLGAIGIGYVVLLAYGGKKKSPVCQFCLEDEVIIVYQEGNDKERAAAKFCPMCGRRLPG